MFFFNELTSNFSFLLWIFLVFSNLIIIFKSIKVHDNKFLRNCYDSVLNKRINISFLLLSVLLALSFCLVIWNNSDTILYSFVDRAIGIAILNGVDPSKRIEIYTLLLIVFPVLIMFNYSNLIVFYKYITNISDKNIFKFEKGIIFNVSLIGIITIFLLLLSNNQINFYYNCNILYFIIILVFLRLIFKVFFNKRFNKTITDIISNDSIFIVSLLFPISIIFLYWTITNGDFIFEKNYYIIYSIWFFVFYILLIFVNYSYKKSTIKENTGKYAVYWFIPFSFFPIIAPLANEIQFSLSNRLNILPNTIAIFIFFILFICFMIIFMKYHKTLRIDDFKIVENLFLPVFIISLVIYRNYVFEIHKPNLDLLHLGNFVTPVQQMFKFNSILFVDYWPPQGLWNAIAGILYSIVNGFRGLECILWDSIIKSLITSVLFYFLLKSFTNPFFSFLFVVLVPFQNLFYSYYDMAFLPALVTPFLLKNLNYKNVSIFVITNVFTFVWMPSLGKACIITLLLILPLIMILSKGDLVNKIKIVFISLITIFSITFLLYVIILLIKDKSVLNILRLIIGFAKVDILNGSYTNIIKNYDSSAVFYYTVFPLIALLYITVAFIKLIKYKVLNKFEIIMFFLSFVSIFLSYRKLARHCLFEAYEPTFFIILLVSLPFLLTNIRLKYKLTMFVFLVISYFFLFPNFEILLKYDKYFSYRQWKNKEQRVFVDNNTQYYELKKFFNKYLNKDQSYFDMINSHLLYTMTKRKCYFFHHTTQMIYSEPMQKVYIDEWKKLNEKNIIPLVLFKGNDWWGSSIDGIPSELSTFRLSEFIYNFYDPLCYVGSYQLWAAKNSDIKSRIIEENKGNELPSNNSITSKLKTSDNKKKKYREILTSVSQDFDLIKLAYIWGKYDEKKPSKNTDLQYRIISSNIKIQTNEIIKLQVKSDIDKSTGNYVHFKIKAASECKLILSYGKTDKSFFKFDIIKSDIFEDYLVRISSQWCWMSSDINCITLQSTAPIEISEINIRKGD